MFKKLRIYPTLTRFFFAARMAAHGILAHPLRSALTILGVTIGVTSVVSLMGIGEGARQAVVSQFESLGSNVIAIKANDASVEFDPDEVYDLVKRVKGMDMATPVIETKAVMRWRRARGNVNIVGVNSQFPEIRDHALASGHFFTELHVSQRSPVAVLGYNMGAGLMGGRNPVGQVITIEGITYRIIGVLAPKGAGKAEEIDDKIIIPYSTAMKIAKKKTVSEIWGKTNTPLEADLAVVQLGRIFKRKLGIDQKAPTTYSSDTNEGGEGDIMEESHDMAMTEEYVDENHGGVENSPIIPGGEDLITITSLNQLVEEADQANRVMTLLLGGIAAVSLLVGGLGIMNIMLVAVTERTSEIGVRRALGAKQLDLLVQFLLEALYVSGIGAIAGTVGGIWGLKAFARHGFQTAISFQAIKIAVVVALASGLLFGIYPAVSASSVPPIEALRRQ